MPKVTERLQSTHSRDVRHVVVALSLSLFVTGCAWFSESTPPVIVGQSYDLPSTFEAHAVIRPVERAFAGALSMPPRIVEGSVPSPRAHFTADDRLVHLDRLGMVNIPEVVRQERMAIMPALVADMSESSGPHRYIGYIQVYGEGYRASVVITVFGSPSAISAKETIT